MFCKLRGTGSANVAAMDELRRDHIKVETKANYGKTINDVQKIIDTLTKAKEGLSSSRCAEHLCSNVSDEDTDSAGAAYLLRSSRVL